MAKVTRHKSPLIDTQRERVGRALARFGRKALDSSLIMRSVGLKLALRDHICLVHTFVFVRRCMGQGTSHAHCASEEPLRLVASHVGGQSAHSERELMCTASLMMVAQACILTTRPEGNWRIFRLQLHGFLSLRLWAVIDVQRGRVVRCTHGRLNWLIGRG